MDPHKERELIKRAQSASYTEAEFVSWYDNVRARGGSQALLDAIKLRMRVDFPRAASKKFGAKTHEVVEVLTRLREEIATRFDLAENKVGQHVKIGGDEQTGKQYICRYLSFKNDENMGTQITVIQVTAESEIQVVVDYYRTNAGDDNFRQSETFSMNDFKDAALLYQRNLEKLGVGLRAPAP